MKFSEFYGFDYSAEQRDWFDVYMPADTKLYVDPFLIYEDTSEMWSSAHEHLLKFFEMAFDLVGSANGNTSSLAWQKARNLLLFPEPAEFCLGVAEGSPRGSGSGSGLQKDVLEGIRVSLELGITRIEHVEMIALFQGGMGVDRISDMVCNILKSYFAEYTQSVCSDLDIPTQKFRVRNARWSERFQRWQDEDRRLPSNPFYPQPVLLTPHRFLRNIPVADINDFWTWAWANEGERLRGDFNYDIAKNVPARTKARLAQRNSDSVFGYLRHLEAQDKKSYPIDGDPKLLTKWYEHGANIVELNASFWFVPSDPDQFPKLVEAIVASFKHYVEEQDGWELLWANGRPRNERAVQALFRGTVIHYCRANNIDLSGESDAGRGPVDFKFSQGWQARAVVEVKLRSNSHFWDGLHVQTPQYQRAEEIEVGFFVAVAFTDRQMEERKVQEIVEVAGAVSKREGSDTRGVVVDARPKRSASRLRRGSS